MAAESGHCWLLRCPGSARGGCSRHRASAAAARGFLGCGSRALERAGFSSFSAWPLEREFSSYGAPAWLLLGTWHLPGPEVKPTFPAWRVDSHPLSHQHRLGEKSEPKGCGG